MKNFSEAKNRLPFLAKSPGILVAKKYFLLGGWANGNAIFFYCKKTSTQLQIKLSFTSMYRCVVAIDEYPTTSAITRTLTPLVASLVMNVLPPLCELAPTIPTHSYKRLTSCVSAFVLNRLLSPRRLSVMFLS